MNIGIYGLIIVFAAFIILLIINPNLSCLGRKLKSPFYPLLRKKKKSWSRSHGTHPAEGQRAGAGPDEAQKPQKPQKPVEDYGFRLDK